MFKSISRNERLKNSKYSIFSEKHKSFSFILQLFYLKEKLFCKNQAFRYCIHTNQFELLKSKSWYIEHLVAVENRIYSPKLLLVKTGRKNCPKLLLQGNSITHWEEWSETNGGFGGVKRLAPRSSRVKQCISNCFTSLTRKPRKAGIMASTYWTVSYMS